MKKREPKLPILTHFAVVLDLVHAGARFWVCGRHFRKVCQKKFEPQLGILLRPLSSVSVHMFEERRRGPRLQFFADGQALAIDQNRSMLSDILEGTGR
jgi:hypothetical protein